MQLHWLHTQEWVSALSRCQWLKPLPHALADRLSRMTALFSGGDFQHDDGRNYLRAIENVVTMLDFTYRLTSSAFSTSPIRKYAKQAAPLARTVGLFLNTMMRESAVRRSSQRV